MLKLYYQNSGNKALKLRSSKHEFGCGIYECVSVVIVFSISLVLLLCNMFLTNCLVCILFCRCHRGYRLMSPATLNNRDEKSMVLL